MTRDLVRVAALVALALVLHAVEAALPALPVPGARLGLANLATVIALPVLGPRLAVGVAAVRALVGGAVAGTFLAPAFFMSLSGAVTSALAMALAYGLVRSGRVSLVGISLLGALVHNLAQLAVAAVLIGYAVVAYLPYLVAFALPAGLVTGVLGRIISVRVRLALAGGDDR